MRVLLVEDDKSKEMEIAAATHATDPNAAIVVARSIASAQALLRRAQFDLILLDMRLPNVPDDGLSPITLGASLEGKRILELVLRRTVQPSVVAISAFDKFGPEGSTLLELQVLWRKKYAPFFKAFVSYNNVRKNLAESLRPFIQALARES
jgi:CheY-like chemotaxis protein